MGSSSSPVYSLRHEFTLLMSFCLIILFTIQFLFSYSKDENIHPGDEELLKFTHLLIESRNKHSNEMKSLAKTHDIIETVECFSNIGIQYNSFFPIKIKTRPCIFILKRKKLLNFKWNEITSKIRKEEFIEETENEIEVKDESVEIIIEDDFHEITILKKVEEEVEEEKKLKTQIPSTKAKIKEIIEAHYRELGSKLESDIDHPDDSIQTPMTTPEPPTSTKANIQKIIKVEKIKQLVDKISKLDLNESCDLDKMDIKECLKKIIDEYDADEINLLKESLL